MIDSAEVEAAFAASLVDGQAAPDAITVEGLVHTAAFDPQKVETQREKVASWIGDLRPEFLRTQDGGGGGWSFLNLCMTKDEGVNWTGLHLRMEQLYLLAAALGLAEIQLPRDLWVAFPGGVPYMVFSTPAPDSSSSGATEAADIGGGAAGGPGGGEDAA